MRFLKFNTIIFLLLILGNLSLASIPNTTDSFWTQFTSQLNLNHADQNPLVQHEIKVMLADRTKFNQILQASTPYLPYIYAQTKAKKLPAEVALIPFIESEFNPNNRSLPGARGLWQLMPATAQIFGLKTSGKSDGRVNLTTSTNAALRYFTDLDTYYKGNWDLVFAAYNSGQGTVDSAVRKAGTKNFFQLKQLPAETQVYVPKLLAVATILKDPAKYNITLPKTA